MLTKIVKTAESVLAVLVYFGIFLLEYFFCCTILTNVKNLMSFQIVFSKKIYVMSLKLLFINIQSIRNCGGSF